MDDIDADLERALTVLLASWRESSRMERDRIYDQLRDFSKGFDQTMITLSAASIGGSVVFLEKVTPYGRQLLIAGWVCLTVALLAILLTYQAAVHILSKRYQKAYEEENKVLQMQMALVQHDHARIRNLGTGPKESDVTQGSYLPWIERGAIGALVAGIIFLLIAATQLTAA